MKLITIIKAPPTAKRIKLEIPYQNHAARKLVKQELGGYYHPNQKLWSILNTKEIKTKFDKLFYKQYCVQELVSTPTKPSKPLNAQSREAIEQLIQKLTLRALSQSTINTYASNLKSFFSYFEAHDISQLSKAQIEAYMYHLVSKYRISESLQNTTINAIKAYYEYVLGKPREIYDIQRPQKSKELPNVLSMTEVAAIVASPKNIKHQAILCTLYSGGLRLGELIRLRIDDIRSDDGYIFIKGAKGKKDRHTVLSQELLVLLRQYYKIYKPSYWLFEGQEGGQYSATSVQKVFRAAVKNANANPWATPHTLRHSFATHLLQQGVSVRIIQAMLGHNSSKTTEIYTHVMRISSSEVQSPLDVILKSNKFGETS